MSSIKKYFKYTFICTYASLILFACYNDTTNKETLCNDIKDGKTLLNNFTCENEGSGIAHLSFNGNLSFSYPVVSELANSNTRTTMQRFKNKKENLNILVIDQISNPNIEIQIVRCEKTWDNSTDEGGNPVGRRCTLKEFAKQVKGAIFVINGGFFHYSDTHYQELWDKNIQPYQIGDPVGFSKIGGKELTSHPYFADDQKNYWGIFSLRKHGDFPWIGSMGSKIDQALLENTNILTAAPLLIRNNSILPLNKLYNSSVERWPGKKDAPGILKHIKMSVPRAAVGVDRKGRVYFLMVDGRMPDISEGMTVDEVTGIFANLDVQNAMNIDGGGSAGIFDVKNNKYITLGLAKKERPIGTAIVIKMRDKPYHIRQITNEKLLSQGAFPHTDYRLVNPKDIAETTGAQDPGKGVVSLTSKYQDENKKFYLRTEEQKKIYRMKIENGVIINPNDNKPASGIGKYVFTDKDELFIAFLKKNEIFPSINFDGSMTNDSYSNPGDGTIMVDDKQKEFEFRHSYFNAGKEVVSAGWIEVQNGQIMCLDNHSGHYRPSWSFFKSMIHNLKYKLAVDLSNAFLYTYAVQHAPQTSRCWLAKSLK